MKNKKVAILIVQKDFEKAFYKEVLEEQGYEVKTFSSYDSLAQETGLKKIDEEVRELNHKLALVKPGGGGVVHDNIYPLYEELYPASQHKNEKFKCDLFISADKISDGELLVARKYNRPPSAVLGNRDEFGGSLAARHDKKSLVVKKFPNIEVLGDWYKIGESGKLVYQRTSGDEGPFKKLADEAKRNYISFKNSFADLIKEAREKAILAKAGIEEKPGLFDK